MTFAVLRAVYTLGWWLALPFALFRLWWRGRKEPGYRAHLGERFGRLRRPFSSSGPVIWLHAVSVGETQAAQPLVQALLEYDDSVCILLTHMTPTGRRTGERLFAQAIAAGRLKQAWLPYDLPPLVRAFLRSVRPTLGLLMETEIWPNLLVVAARQGIPVGLVNGRLSPRSFARMRSLRGVATAVLKRFAVVLAQTPGDTQRYRELGVMGPQTTGNLKFDAVPAPALCEAGLTLRLRLAGRRVLCAASTRDGEEPLVLDAWRRVLAAWPAARGLAPLLILVPRHPQRFDEVMALVEQAGLRAVRRSRLAEKTGYWPMAEVAAVDVLLGDSMGEMPMYYAASDLALIGGSLMPLGGQNLIEACAVGTPVLLGPYTFNFAQASADAIEAGAARRVPADSEALAQACADILSDDAARQRMGAAALDFAQGHQGATERTLQALTPWLDATSKFM